MKFGIEKTPTDTEDILDHCFGHPRDIMLDVLSGKL